MCGNDVCVESGWYCNEDNPNGDECTSTASRAVARLLRQGTPHGQATSGRLLEQMSNSPETNRTLLEHRRLRQPEQQPSEHFANVTSARRLGATIPKVTVRWEYQASSSKTAKFVQGAGTVMNLDTYATATELKKGAAAEGMSMVTDHLEASLPKLS